MEEWQEVPCIIGHTRRSKQIWTRLYGDPGKLWVLHRCGRRLCWEPRHFYLGTASDNIRDTYRDNPDLRDRYSRMRRGIPKSEAHKAAISAAKMGHLVSPELRQKLSAALRGRPWSEARRAASQKEAS